MLEGDVYDYKTKGGAFIAILFLLVLVAFTGAMMYAAGWAEFEFNGHPASPGERTFMLVAFPLMMSPFLYVFGHGLLKHWNEKIVWSQGQLCWTDSLGRERVTCSEADITGERRDQLWVNGLVRYEIETRSGPIRFLSSMPRCAELRARLASHLKGEKTTSAPPPDSLRQWQARTVYTFRSGTGLISALSPILFLLALVFGMRFPIDMVLFAAVPVELISAYFVSRYFLMRVEVKDNVIVFYNVFGKPRRRVRLQELRGVDEQSGDTRWLRVALEGGKSFIVGADMQDYREFYAELRRLTGSPES